MNFSVFPGFPSRLRIRIMNVKYSPNLGDGLLTECLEAAILESGNARDAVSIDLAGRSAYGDGGNGRGLALAVLNRLPAPLRALAVRPLLALKARRSWAPHYRRGMAGAGAMVIGGGNLLTDHDLNFPTKLALAFEAARAAGVPVAIHAAGMGGGWSREGLRRMRAAMKDNAPRAVFLRDAGSKRRWDETFGADTGVLATVVRDPGLLASEVWPRRAAPRGDGPLIGIGIMSAEVVRYHSAQEVGARTLGDWYVGLAAALAGAGARVVTFTNGSPEDVAFARRLAPRLAAIGGGIAHVDPKTPQELAGLVSSCKAIAAYRMHAVIAAYSYGVPALALKWDIKLDSFMASVGRARLLRDPATTSPEAAAEVLLQAAAEGVDERMRRRVLGETRRDVALMLEALGAPARISATLPPAASPPAARPPVAALALAASA